MTADDIFYVLEDNLHYPGIKSAIDKLSKWEWKNLWGDLDEVLQKEYDRGAIDADKKYDNGFFDGKAEGQSEGYRKGYVIALQDILNLTDDLNVINTVVDLAEQHDLDIEIPTKVEKTNVEWTWK